MGRPKGSGVRPWTVWTVWTEWMGVDGNELPKDSGLESAASIDAAVSAYYGSLMVPGWDVTPGV